MYYIENPAWNPEFYHKLSRGLIDTECGLVFEGDMKAVMPDDKEPFDCEECLRTVDVPH